MRDVREISNQGFKGCVGIESEGQILKIDLAGARLGRVLKFLSAAGVSTHRLNEVVSFARQLNQVQTNYFALKYNSQGLFGWKIYFAVSQ